MAQGQLGWGPTYTPCDIFPPPLGPGHHGRLGGESGCLSTFTLISYPGSGLPCRPTAALKTSVTSTTTKTQNV